MRRRKTRKYPRTSVDLPVECIVGGRKLHRRASALGGGGILLNLKAAPARASEVRIRFRPAKNLPLIEAAGRIVYQTPQGAAIKFTAISSANRQLLLRILSHKNADQRRHPRAPLATQIVSDKGMSLAFSRNIAVSGMFIATRRPFDAGTRFGLRFHLEDGHPAVVVQAQVAYAVAKLGMGVEFLSVAPSDRKRIAAYVAKSPAARKEPGTKKTAN